MWAASWAAWTAAGLKTASTALRTSTRTTGASPASGTPGAASAGVAGYSSPGGSTAVTVTECYNYADLTDTGDPDKTGGILGGARGSVTVENCANYGDIESKGKYVGGIAGQTENTAVRIGDCRQ